MLKGCEIYINGAPCPMCMSAIYWSRIDHVYFGSLTTPARSVSTTLSNTWTSKPWEERSIAVTEGFERETGLKAYQAWTNKRDRHPY